jgi:hypothetical protein
MEAAAISVSSSFMIFADHGRFSRLATCASVARSVEGTGRTAGSTRVDNIDALQFGHPGVSISSDDLVGFPLHLDSSRCGKKKPLSRQQGLSAAEWREDGSGISANREPP